MHWISMNSTFTWQGMHKGGHHGACSVVLEAVANYVLRIWHTFLGMIGSHNDRLAESQAPECNYVINGHRYNKGYYLTDDIYPTVSTFVKIVRNSVRPVKKRFAQRQESARKDVE